MEVDLSLFLRPQWDCAAGRQGWMEDNTVLRGCREYQPGDSWKHINWRMAAREQGTPVNLYQTIQPRGLRFLLDGESFCGLSQDWRELEGALEVLASVLSGLSGAGVDCSLSLPHSRLFGPMTVSSGEGGGDDLLFYLAGYRCLAQRVPEESRSPQGPAFLPSRFAADAAPQSGTAYLITCSGSRETGSQGSCGCCAPRTGRSPPGPGSGPSPWTPCGKGGAAREPEPFPPCRFGRPAVQCDCPAHPVLHLRLPSDRPG